MPQAFGESFTSKLRRNLFLTQLVVNLEKYSEEDDVVRNLIDRKTRVIKARTRIEEVGNQTMTRATVYEGSGRKSKLMY